MTRKIGLWSLAGFIVACGWVLFTMAAGPTTLMQLESRRLFWAIAEVTAPASLLRHFATKYYWFILLNAVAYAFVGFAFELLRRLSVRHAYVR